MGPRWGLGGWGLKIEDWGLKIENCKLQIENWGWGGAEKGSGDILVAEFEDAEPDFLGRESGFAVF